MCDSLNVYIKHWTSYQASDGQLNHPDNTQIMWPVKNLEYVTIITLPVKKGSKH